MSNTPRTDAAAAEPYSPDGMRKTTNLVAAKFARILERELATTQAKLREAEKGQELLRAALHTALNRAERADERIKTLEEALRQTLTALEFVRTADYPWKDGSPAIAAMNVARRALEEE
jgi:hypothetical protein